MVKPWCAEVNGVLIGFDPGDPRGDVVALVKMRCVRGHYYVDEVLLGPEATAEAEKYQPKPIDLKDIQSLIGK